MARKRVLLLIISLVCISSQAMLLESNKAFPSDKQQFATKVTKNKLNNETCSELFGIEYFQDYSGKWFIWNVIENSVAQRHGLAIGNEIVEVNSLKAKKLRGSELHTQFKAPTANLIIKNNDNKKISYTLTKTLICIPETHKDPLFDMYWSQIYMGIDPIQNYEFLLKLCSFFNKLTFRMRAEINQTLPETKYWAEKEVKFRNIFNTCKINNQSEQEFNNCLSGAVNIINREITHDREIALQQQYIQTQQQMQQEQINALNNYADSLRNQNVNVKHSGTINSNIYHNGTMNVNHYRNYGYYYGW